MDRKGNLFELIGGMSECERLSQRFHDRVAGDSEFRKIFPKDLTQTTGWFTRFLAEELGGPGEYRAKRGKQSLVCRHAHLQIGTAEAETWLGHMFAAMEEVGVPEPLRPVLQDYFTRTAKPLTDPYYLFYRMPLEELWVHLKENPKLATASDLGRTLLGDAAGRWDLPRVRLLLESGANANAGGGLDRSPMYRATNACFPGLEEEGRAVVEMLLGNGAEVNLPCGVGRSTPLHMTARRGSVLLAEVLVDAGAELELKDSKGETALRRAVNCGKEGMVTYLLSRGADPESRDKFGRTPLMAARHEPIRRALRRALE